ncbi:MAG: hypothetical protein LC772_03465, partial [Chloroflexi bacterium]|nr:hypothetical protein [Chloroflexota bacterium]
MRSLIRSPAVAAQTLLLIFGGWGISARAGTPAPHDAPRPHSASAPFPKLTLSTVPLFFERNQGQTATEVKFLARIPG